MQDIKSSLSSPENLNLESWGLPPHVLEKYQRRGIKSMFPWQVECLLLGDVLNGQNLVYSAPTSAGKTLVAEMLLLKTVLEKRQKVIIILPFISVVREKMLYLQEILSGSGIRVDGFMGSYNPPGGFRAVHVAICTIEKANSLINRLLEERSFDNIGCVVVDELHLIGDPHRGYLLELLLTKIKYISDRGLNQIQIIGMSATLPNLDDLARWLNAALYKTDFRPIELKEYLKVGHSIYVSKELRFSHEISSESLTIKNDPGDVIFLCIETILLGFSVLVFCSTKNWCESVAQQIAVEIRRLGCSKDEAGIKLREQLNSEAILDTLEQLKKCPAGLESSLEKSVSFGVGYHHAGLTMDERDIIEGAFRKNILRVIVATSTLSSGVNLPARRVIVRSPSFVGNKLDILSYKQMIGRAGRMGKDTEGESYLICTEENKNFGQQLLNCDLPNVESCLGQGNLSSSLKRALIEVLASGIVTSKREILEYTNCTLLAATSSQDIIDAAITTCLKYLEKNNFISKDNSSPSSDNVVASALAVACLSSSLSPDQALVLLKELDKARKCFVLESDLHAVYQVTPFTICDHISLDWMKMFSIWETLSPGLQKVGHLVGVEESFLIKAMRSAINVNSDQYHSKLSIHKRFYTALALQDLINEVPLKEVVKKFDFNKGMLQSLQQSASTFSGMVTSFCRKLGWNALEVVLAELGARIQFGVQRDLLDLMRLNCMTGQIARSLHNAGIESVSDLAHADLRSICIAIKRSTPFISENSEVVEDKQKQTVCLPGRPGLTEMEAADIFIHEARTFLLREMGVQNAEWNNSNNDSLQNSIYDCSTLLPANASRKAGIDTTEKVIVDKSSPEKCLPKKTEATNLLSVGHAEGSRVSHAEGNGVFNSTGCSDKNLKMKSIPTEESEVSFDTEEVLVPATQEIGSQLSSSLCDGAKLADVDFILPKYLHKEMDEVSNIASNNIGNFSLRFSESYLIPTKGKQPESNVELTIGDFKNANCSTPIGTPELVKEDTKLSKNIVHQTSLIVEDNKTDSVCYNHSCDLFDSPNDVCKNNVPEDVANQENFGGLDPNWGGDSLLQVSFIEQEIKHLICNIRKRKLNSPIDDHKTFSKKIRFSAEITERKSSTSDMFESFELNTQLEKEVNNQEVKSLFASPLPLPENIKNCDKDQSKNNIPGDSFLINAFEQTFDAPLTENIKKLKPSLPLEQPNPNVGGNLMLSDEEDIFLDNSLIARNLAKAGEACNEWSTPTKKNSHTTPVKLFSPSKGKLRSPKSNAKQKKLSPSKYPSVDVSIVKSIKSPHKFSKKSLKKIGPSTVSHVNENFIQTNKSLVEPEIKNKNYSSDSEKFSVINLCSEEKLIQDFLSALMNKKAAAVAIQVEKKAEDKRDKIGGKFINNSKPTSDIAYFEFNEQVIKGIVFTWGIDVYKLELRGPDCTCFNALKCILQMTDIKLFGFKIKDQIKLLSKCCNILVRNELFDVSVAKWLLEPSEIEYSLKDIVKETLILPKFQFKNIQDNDDVQNVVMIWFLHNEIIKKLEHSNLYGVYTDVEMPAQFILMNMEMAGFGFNRDKAMDLWTKTEEMMRKLEKEAFLLANKKFSINSWKEFKKIKEELKIKNDFENEHPLLGVVRNWRKLNSLKSRTLSNLLMADSSDGRLYTECCTRTNTGRIVVYNPHLQHVPRDFSVGNELFSPRSTFIASKSDVLLSADFCQLELRILTHLSKDPLLTSMINSNIDVFVSIASGWFKVDCNQVNEEMRHQTKQICYGILYGMGDISLGESLGVSTTEAAEMAAKFRLSYPGVNKFIEKCVEDCRNNGYITTITGRIRKLPNINSRKRAERLQAERQAVNSTIQGSAADIAKKAMVNIERRLTNVFPQRTSLLSRSSASHLVLQLHDELIYQVAEENIAIVSNIVKNEMENTIKLSVPLPVVLKAGKSWGELKKINI
ncbi:hypothetical protein O3M35_008360 [Rhynocoris fuscipes]|uniref:DNA-directed DNA polymerase n=1 Tax=Rhynocoris fuscipes TaxID=488301 RepID=A0AAW1DCY9_9HEMI